MGTISSGIGLVSGIDTQDVIRQLMAIEARPRVLVEQRVEKLNAQKTALMDINARLLGLREASKSIGEANLFRTKRATSSNESILTATANRRASEGTHNLAVSRLVSTHQLISRGFTDTDATALGEGTLRFQSHLARLDREVALSELNGQAGAGRGHIGITDRSGAAADVDLTRAVTLNDVLDAINSASGVRITASLDGDRLKLTDTSGGTAGDLTVEDLGGNSAAADLGIAGSSDGSDTLTGSQINRIAADTRLNALNDGNGVRVRGSGQADVRIDLDGDSFDVTLAGAASVGDVIERINDHADNPGVTASIGADGVSLRLEGSGTIGVSAIEGSKAAADLGFSGSAAGSLDGERVLAALGSTLLGNLHGGAGVNQGVVEITNREGVTTSVDLSGARSVVDVIETINGASAGVTASLNRAGNGIELTDTTGATDSNLIVADASGSLAADLGLATEPGGVAAERIDGGDLSLRHISGSTRLETLNAGRGVTTGKFTITDSNGVSSTVDLTQGDETTIRHVIAEINSRSADVTAQINDTGDGIILIDNAGGPGKLKVEEAGSTTARDLGILGIDEAGDGFLDGSFARSVEVEATDTIDDVVDKINEAGFPVQASIVRDGSAGAPYRLNLTSAHSGAAGRMVFDDGGLDLRAQTLVDGEDAVALFGSADPARALLLTSETNTLSDALRGVTIDLHGASADPVQLTVSRDDDAAVEAVEGFVEAYNEVLASIGKHDSFDQETEQRGVLLGDPTVSRVRHRLFNEVNARVTGVSGQFDHLSQVGLRVGEGGRLELDEQKFGEALRADPDGVRELFTRSTTGPASAPDVDLPEGVTIPSGPDVSHPVGFGKKIEDLLKRMTDSIDGTLTLRTNSIDGQVEQANRRIEHLNKLLAGRRQRLEAQFVAMERALAQLQSQQDSLGGLAGAAFFASTGGQQR